RGDEHVDAAEPFDRSLPHRVVVGLRRGVDVVEQSFASALLHARDGLGPRFVEKVADENVGAFVREAFTTRASDAVAAAGDDGDPPLESSRHEGVSLASWVWRTLTTVEV